MKKVFLLLLVMGLVFVAGCNSPIAMDKDGGVVIKGEDGEEIKIGEDSMEITDKDGSKSTVTAGDEGKLPDGYPSNVVPLMKGGKITWSNKSTQNNQTFFNVNADYDKKSEEVFNFYKDKLSDMEDLSTTEGPDFSTMSGIKDNYNIIVSVTSGSDEDATALSIILTLDSE